MDKYFKLPIVDVETGEYFENFKQLKKEKKLRNDDIWDICGVSIRKDFPYHFVDEDNLEYCWGDGTDPEHASIGDIRSGKAKAYIFIPRRTE